jgi:uncharacterized protein YbjT (DUF2867 family)
LIGQSSIPYSIVRATQFFEFLKGLADISVVDGKVHLPPVLFQPMAADDVASGVARIAVSEPVNGSVEIAGPEQFRVDELVRRCLASLKDPREVIADPKVLYSGAKLSERTLLRGNDARLGETRFVAPKNWPRPVGRIDAALIANSTWPSGAVPTCYVCGPTSFVESVSALLLGCGNKPDKVRTERFGPTGGRQ